MKNQKYYPDGRIFFDCSIVDDAFNLPYNTKEEQKIRRKAMKKVNKDRNIYVRVATPYLSALRTVQLYEGYNNISEIISGYDDAVKEAEAMREKINIENNKLLEEQRLDIERKRAQRKLKQRK